MDQDMYERAERALEKAKKLSMKGISMSEIETAASVCTCCELHVGRKTPVFAKGNQAANIFVCGMVPADEENKAGIPFVGRAGKLLDKILLDSGLSTDSVYITNLVKCYLAAGLPLKQSWIDSCLPFLVNQVGLLKPKVIITLGKDSATSLLGMDNKTPLSKIRSSRVYDYSDGIKVIPTYHPSYLLRGGGEGHKSYSNVLSDFNLAKELASAS